jgi:hypothetical protein
MVMVVISPGLVEQLGRQMQEKLIEDLIDLSYVVL